MCKILNRIGEKYTTNQGYIIEIVEHHGKNNCTIKFENEVIISKIRYDNIIKGKVNNPYSKSVFGVGFLGVGKYKATINRKSIKSHSIWRGMLHRSYSEKEHKRNPTYKNVTVCEEWHNFQNFAKWHEQEYNPKTMQGWDLDKDIIFKGNKIYSPQTCCFVPKEINYIILKSNTKRGEYPIGVSFNKEKLKYVAQGKVGGRKKFLGYFNTPEEAFEAYKIAKEQHIKEIADKWRGQITEQVYNALYNYQVEITD